ncbi:MAG: hypothetical protein ABII00_18770 [Elusimicrobiota bacterium]
MPRDTTPPEPSRYTAREWRLVRKCRTPLLAQRWLKSLPYNYERRGETLRTFRQVVRLNTAHCLEAALSVAAVLTHHGYPPLLLDIESKDDLDHVLFLFQENSGWGTVAKSRDPGLFGRKPVFRSVRDLVRSYRAPFVDHTGRVTGYGVFDLRTFKGPDWRFSTRNVWSVEKALIAMPHRRFRTPDREYERWHERYERYQRRYPDRKPLYFPDRRRWL